MKSLDRYLRDARIAHARKWIPRGSAVLDVGCGDGELFRALEGDISRGVGIEPTLEAKVTLAGCELLPGNFPDSVPVGDEKFDVVTMLAVLEHITPDGQAKLASACDAVLNPGGRVVITVPSPRVDDILHVLLALRLIDGISAHEHYGFKPALTTDIFPAPTYRLLKRQRFQLGLNNLFVFEKVGEAPIPPSSRATA